MMGFFARHPIASGVGGIILLFLLYRMFSGGGGSSQTATSGGLDPNAVAAATALQQSQLAANAQTQQYQLEAQAQNAQIAGQVQVASMQQQLGLAQIAANSTTSQQQTQASVDIAGMQAQSTNLASTLAAQVQQAGLNAQVQVANIGANVTNTQTGAMVQLANIGATVTNNQPGAMVQMNAANQQTIQAVTGIQAGVVNNQTAAQLAQTKSTSLCFLTTAACEHMGMPDDCYVLTTLRAYRDGWLTANAPGEIVLYYREAPGIVARLDARPDAGMVYTLMWHDFILPAVHCVERGQNRAAFAIYANMFETFKQLAVAGVPRTAGIPRAAPGMGLDVIANDDGTVSFSMPRGEVVDIESQRIVESDGAA